MLNLTSLNQRVNALTAKINTLIPPAGGTLSAVLTAGNSAGTNDIDMNSNDILQVNNIDLTTINGSAYPPAVPADDLQAVLTAGNDSDLSIVLKNTLVAPTSTLTIDEANLTHSATGATNLNISSNQNLTLSADNIDLSSAGRLIVPSLASGNYLDYNPSTSTLEIQQTTAGSLANPMLRLDQQDTNAGSANITFFKNTSTNGNAIGDLSFRAKTAITGNPEREYARIGGTIRNNASGNVDGSISFQARVNDAITEMMRINGADSHIEIFQPLDLNNNDIVSATGDIELNATASSGTGDIFLTPKVATGAVKVSKDIITESKIANAGLISSSVNFAGSTPDERFTIDKDKIELYNTDSSNYTSTQQIFQDYNIGGGDAYIQQTYLDVATTTTTTNTLRNDLTSQSLTMNNSTTTENSALTIQRLFIGDNTNNKSVSINNSNGLGAGENRIDLFKNSGGGISNSSGFSNTTSTQQVFLNSTDNAVGKNVSVYNGTSGNGGITYDNTQDTNPFIISSANTQLSLQTSGTAVGSGNIEFLPSQNGSANGQIVFTGASLQSNTSSGNSGEHLVIVLNGNTYKIKLENP